MPRSVRSHNRNQPTTMEELKGCFEELRSYTDTEGSSSEEQQQTSACSEEELVSEVSELVRRGAWRTLVARFHAHEARSRVLWVFPSARNLRWLGRALRALQVRAVLSLGCGSGLLEWLVSQATGLAAAGVEVDGAWWGSRHAPPAYCPRLLTPPEPAESVRAALCQPHTALLCCYFNDGRAFERYLRLFAGSVLVLVGPHGKPVHTDPGPFAPLPAPWTLYGAQEVRTSKDFIAIYCKNQ